jgi:hypothetical protein
VHAQEETEAVKQLPAKCKRPNTAKGEVDLKLLLEVHLTSVRVQAICVRLRWTQNLHNCAAKFDGVLLAGERSTAAVQSEKDATA